MTAVALPVSPIHTGSPFRLGLLVAVVAMDLAALALVVSGWSIVSGSLDSDRHGLGILVGLVGLVISAMGHCWLLLIGRRVVREATGAVVRDLAALRFERVGRLGVTGSGDERLATAEMAMYHRPNCAFVANKPAMSATVTAHRAAGRQPCGVCRP